MTYKDKVKATVNALVDRYGTDGCLTVATKNRDAATNDAHREFYADVCAYIIAALTASD